MKSRFSQRAFFAHLVPACIRVGWMRGWGNHSKTHQKAKTKTKLSETPESDLSRTKQSPYFWSADPVPECCVTRSRPFNLSGFQIPQVQRWPRQVSVVPRSFRILEVQVKGVLLLFWLCKSRAQFAVPKYPCHVTQALNWFGSLGAWPTAMVQASHIQFGVDSGNQGIFLWTTASLLLFTK